MRQNIPAELRQLKQWAVCGSHSKIPFNPQSGQVASPVDPSTWGTFEEALASGAPNIGFMLVKGGAYTVIDLDDKLDNPASDKDKERFKGILEFFDSYTELSTSGRGIHIWVKGSIPEGVNRDHIELYHDARFMICTGNVLKQRPIADGYQETLSAMYEQMKPPDASVELVEESEVISDEEILTMASAAVNGEKFDALCGPDWESMGYESPSQADMALLAILGFYTRSDEQVRRIFRLTPLGRRLKAGELRHKNDKAIDFALRKVRAKQPPPVDLSAILNRVSMVIDTPALPAVKVEAPIVEAPTISNITLPPGLVGEVAQYVYQTSIRPVPEIALATAIAFVAGIAGRAFNTSTRAGLAQYIALLAKTGTGKEAAASAISRILLTVRPKIPASMDFMGPSVFASGPALHRIMSAKPCFVSVLGEFGLLLQKLSNKNANTADLTLKKTLLDAYGKSGYGDMLQPSVYSDKEKDVAAISSPNITILGESTPESFYDSLDASAVTSGFLPRFFIIEYFGERPPRNPNPNGPPSEGLINRVTELLTYALTANANNTCMPVIEDNEGKRLLDSFDLECDAKMRGQGDVLTEVWNRAHLKALKLSALIAVGVNPHNPVVTGPIATWAIDLIRGDSSRLSERFRKGAVGEGHDKQRSVVIEAIKWYLSTTHKSPKREAFKAAGFIERSAIHPRVSGHTVFTALGKDSLRAFNGVIEDLIKTGELVLIDSLTLKNKFNTAAQCYGVGDNWNPGE